MFPARRVVKCLVLRPRQWKVEKRCCVMFKTAEGERGKRVLAAAVEDGTALFLEPYGSTLHESTTFGIVEVEFTTLGEAFFRALITEDRFEDENNIAIDNNVGDQEDPNVNDKQEVKKVDDQEIENVKDEEGKNVEDEQVFDGDDDTNDSYLSGEALGVDEDEPNRVISVLKDGGGEFDNSIDE
nr:hypothetical protein [Tanacetum cinerariifolium]